MIGLDEVPGSSCSPEARPRSGGAPRALVAQDDDALRAFLAELLDLEGFEVTVCRDGAELLSYLADQLLEPEAPGYELIVADHVMSGLTGLEILEGLRDCGVTTPAILLTAPGERSIASCARALGDVGVLEKPLALEDLRREVRRQPSPWHLAA